MEPLTVAAVRTAIEQSQQTGNFWLDMPLSLGNGPVMLCLMVSIGLALLGSTMLWDGRSGRSGQSRRALVATAVATLGSWGYFGLTVVTAHIQPLPAEHQAMAQVILQAEAYLRVDEPRSATVEQLLVARSLVEGALREAEKQRRQQAFLKGGPLVTGALDDTIDLSKLALLQARAPVN